MLALAFEPGPDAGAGFGGLGEGFRAFEQFGPEGPGAALHGADGIDAADGAAVGQTLEEDAIPAVWAGGLGQGPVSADFPGVLAEEIVAAELEVAGDVLDFAVIEPDVAGRAGAAVAAHGAGEFQAVGVPGLGLAGLGLFGWFGGHKSSLADMDIRVLAVG